MIAFANYVLSNPITNNYGQLVVSIKHVKDFKGTVSSGIVEHEPGDSVILYIPGVEKGWKAKVNKAHPCIGGGCTYDLQVKFPDGTKSRFWNIEASSIEKIKDIAPGAFPVTN